MSEAYSEIYNILESIAPDRDFRMSSDFVDDALLDSFDIVLLVTRLEEQFGTEIPGEAISADRFRNVAAIADLVQ